MSMGIYFNAGREAPKSGVEEAEINRISDKYWSECPHKDIFEGPGFFNDENDGKVYSGMIRIPMELPMDEMEDFLTYWLKWLTDVTRVLHDAEWEVVFEEIPLLWEEEEGWRWMSDEEYSEMGME